MASTTLQRVSVGLTNVETANPKFKRRRDLNVKFDGGVYVSSAEYHLRPG